jgi:thiamine-monophosphate kinase
VAFPDLPPGARLAASTDTSIEGVHFRWDWLSARDIGYRATASALSDLAAAAASPIGVLIAMSLSSARSDSIDEIARGIGEAARDSGAKIIGGDMSLAEQVSLTITVLGASSRPLSRAGARPGDHLFVTGELGLVQAALTKLERGERPNPREMTRFARPSPRISEAIWLAHNGATAAIDISDGLGSELRHLAAASSVGARVILEQVPAYQELTPLQAMASGEEYELLFAAPQNISLDDFRRNFATPVTDIGEVVGGSTAVELYSGGRAIAVPQGYSHF